MQKKLLILSLGKPQTNGYAEVTYHLDNKEYTTRYVAEALIQFTQPDEVIIIGTADSIWDEMFDAFYEADGCLPSKTEADQAWVKMSEIPINDKDGANRSLEPEKLAELSARLTQQYSVLLGGRIFGRVQKVTALLTRYGIEDVENRQNFRLLRESIRATL